MREQMRNTDRAFSNIESHPEGFNALRRMYENIQVQPNSNGAPVLHHLKHQHSAGLSSTCLSCGWHAAQEPLMDAAANDAANAAAGAGSNPFASLAAGVPSSAAPAATSTGAPTASAAPAVPNTSPLPNPWAPAAGAASQPLGGAALVKAGFVQEIRVEACPGRMSA